MTEDQLLKFQHFTSKAVLADQTELVNAFLQWETDLKEQLSRMYGSFEYLTESGDEDDQPPWLLFKDLIEKTCREIEGLDQTIQETQDQEELDLLHLRRKKLEANKIRLSKLGRRDKYVFEWWLVPAWMGQELINLGEVVYKCLGCTFWGVSTLFRENHTKEETLAGIFEEMHKY